MNQKYLKLCAVLTALLLLSVGLQAEDGTDSARIAALEKAVAELKAAPSAAADPSTIRVFWNKGIKLKSGDGNIDANIGGRLQWDMTFQKPDSKAKNIAAIWSGQDYDQTEFRRARFEMGGEAYHRFIFKLEVDFAGGGVQLRDVWFGFNTHTEYGGKFLIGSFKEPQEMEESTSDLNLTFLERSMINSFVADYSSGFGWFSSIKDADKVDRVQWGVSIARDISGTGNSTGAGVNGRWNFSLRVSGLPYYVNKGEQLIHIGGWVSLRDPNGATRPFTIAAKPDIHVGNSWVSTGAVNTDGVTMYGAELAGVFQQFWFEAEYASANLSKPHNAAPGVKASTFDGYYVMAGFFLTGEFRPYKTGGGTFDRVTPKHNAFETDKDGNMGLGAIELAARYDYLNCEDTSANIFGGKLTTVSVEANWYLAANYRIMIGYINASLDKKNASPPKTKGSENIATMRFQADW